MGMLALDAVATLMFTTTYVAFFRTFDIVFYYNVCVWVYIYFFSESYQHISYDKKMCIGGLILRPFGIFLSGFVGWMFDQHVCNADDWHFYFLHFGHCMWHINGAIAIHYSTRCCMHMRVAHDELEARRSLKYGEKSKASPTREPTMSPTRAENELHLD